MAEHPPPEGSSTGNASAESSESTVELNIKTLDSQMHSFCVDKNIPVSAFKEKIAGKIGLPVGQQRLIFRGMVLKDDHLLSEYHVDNGHTLHLVARQPSQLQSSSSDSVGDRTADTANGGLNSSAPGLSTTVGQVSHGVILGPFSTGEQGESPVPDLVQVIGAVLNSLGIGNQNSVNVSGDLQNPTQTSQGSEAERRQPTAGYQSQSGNQSLPRQAFSSQPLRQIMQIPLGAILSSTNELIPDSLHTISEFMTLIETTLIGNQPNQSSDNTGALPSVTLPVDSRGMPTAETLGVILRHAQWLLGDCAIDALSQVADLLEEERDLSDTTIRSLVQTYAMQVGIVMQDLGALLLEIGRTMLALHMGRSPGESYVNSGPAVYISPSGSNPIMVQPSPLQSTSLFGGFVAPSSATGGAGPITRNMNIHMNTGIHNHLYCFSC